MLRGSEEEAQARNEGWREWCDAENEARSGIHSGREKRRLQCMCLRQYMCLIYTIRFIGPFPVPYVVKGGGSQSFVLANRLNIITLRTHLLQTKPHVFRDSRNLMHIGGICGLVEMAAQSSSPVSSLSFAPHFCDHTVYQNAGICNETHLSR